MSGACFVHFRLADMPTHRATVCYRGGKADVTLTRPQVAF